MDDRHIYHTYINTCNVLVIVIQNASHRAYKNQVQLFNIVKHTNFTRCLHVAGCVIEGGITIEACTNSIKLIVNVTTASTNIMN